MKRIFSLGLLASVFVSVVAHAGAPITNSQKSLMGEQASLGLGYSAHEGQSGYYLDLRWQFNDYAEISFGVDSYLNAKTYDVTKFPGAFPNVDAIGVEEFRDTFGDGMFRPRHNTYSFNTTLRYPFPLTRQTMFAPYIELGASKMSTKDVVFTEQKSTGSTGTGTGTGTGTSVKVLTLSFQDLDSFRAGAGFQLGFGDAHRWSLGAVGYSKNDDWSELDLEDDQVGAAIRYEYRPAKQLGIVARLETVDQFGDPWLSLGVNWVFSN